MIAPMSVFFLLLLSEDPHPGNLLISEEPSFAMKALVASLGFSGFRGGSIFQFASQEDDSLVLLDWGSVTVLRQDQLEVQCLCVNCPG